MDNLCHSLAGAAIAQTGFARRLPRATLLAVVAANIPDVDALAYFFGDSAFAVSFRRGWTHGIPALIGWALLLAGVFSWLSRRRPVAPALKSTTELPWLAYLPLAAIAVVSHPALDWLNTYGVRFLMPFSDTWFYGDTLFIVDPTLIGLFGLGWFVSSRLLASGSGRAELPARTALVVAVTYIAAMKGMSESTRLSVERQARTTLTRTQLMVAPLPLSFTRREIMMQASPSLYRSSAVWVGMHAELGTGVSSELTGATSDIVMAVRATTSGGRFLRWARFPYFVRGTGSDSGTVFVGDARYSSGTEESWAGIRVPLK